MNGIQEMLMMIDEIEMIVIRTTGLIGVFTACFIVLRHHIKSFGKSVRRRRPANKTKKRSEDEPNKEDKENKKD